MKQSRQRKLWEAAGLAATLLLGNLLHFVYDWTGQARWSAYLAAVNESTWEHMKLLAVPWVIWTAVSWLGQREARCAAPRAVGLLAGLAAIPVLFYTYTGATGRSIDLVNVLLFQVAVLLAWWVSRTLQRRGALTAPLWCAAGVAVQVGLIILFCLWTLQPPDLPLFSDPTNATRGLPPAG